MPISSRTPEGDPNYCPVCGKVIRIQPSETPTRDAPCPHCGQLLWFAPTDEEHSVILDHSAESYEGTLLKLGREKFGTIPGRLVHPLTEALGSLIQSHRVYGGDDLKCVVHASSNWKELTFRLRRAAGMPSRLGWFFPMRHFIRRQFRRFGRRRLSKPNA
jgi:hypothetical protein